MEKAILHSGVRTDAGNSIKGYLTVISDNPYIIEPENGINLHKISADSLRPILDEQIEKLRDLLKIQDDCSTGPDPYMSGMYNGMELLLSVLENERDPVFKHFDEVAGLWVKDAAHINDHVFGSSGERIE